jgi:hypothetical protein
MKTMLRGDKDGVSVTNHIYLMTSDPGPVQSTRDAGYDRICGEIDSALLGLSLHHSTKDEIWRCIQQVEGYQVSSWKAILVKLDIPEKRHYNMLQIMASASRDRKLSEFRPFGLCFNLTNLQSSLDLVVSLRSILAYDGPLILLRSQYLGSLHVFVLVPELEMYKTLLPFTP